MTLRAFGVAAALLSAACRPDATLLFLGRSPAAQVGDLTWAADAERGRLVAFNRQLQAVKSITDPRLGAPVAVANVNNRLLVTEQTGDGLVFDTSGAFVREWTGPHPVTLYAALGPRIVATRSPYRVPQFRAEPPNAPLFVELDSLGRPWARLGTIRMPQLNLLVQVENAGAIALGPGGEIYYAPLTRDAFERYEAGGERRWTVQRGLALPINTVALTLVGTRLYALGAADSGVTRLRVDVLDAATGQLLDALVLDTNTTAVAVTADGRLRTFDAAAALARLEPAPREPFAPAFALPGLDGDTIRLSHYAGRVTLVNFWASWCDPCREEFPHMAGLFRDLPAKDFGIAAISDDVDQGAMWRFVREFRPPFPILVGAGDMKGRYHYRGLPYSVLLDRQGRVVERIFGFGGPAEFDRLRQTIAREIAVP